MGAEVGTAESKLEAFKRAEIPVASTPWEIPKLVKQAMIDLRQQQA
jgi:succinyl-CoA synthetase alpha subunit